MSWTSDSILFLGKLLSKSLETLEAQTTKRYEKDL